MAVDYSKAEGREIPTDKEMEAVVELARDQVRLEQKIARAKQELTDLNAEYQRLRMEALPEAMKQIGMNEFKLDNGVVISVKDDLNANIKEENKRSAYDWLREHGHGSIIKNQLTLNLPSDKPEEREAAVEYMELMDWDYDLKEAIHANTLNAWAKKQQEDGDDPIPEELINVFRYSVSKVSIPKKR